MSVKYTLRHFFIPHEGNNYHPHILHTKRALLYSGVFIVMKIIVFAFVLLLPLRAFVMPDVLNEEQKNIIDLTNAVREKVGVHLLDREQKLYTSAQMKSDDMVAHDYFDHVSPEGHDLAYFLHKVDYNYQVAGENLGMGFFQADDLVNAWIESPTHYANLIDPDYHEIGIGLAMGEYDGMPTIYATQHFGTPKEVSSGSVAAAQIIADDGASAIGGDVNIKRDETNTADIVYNRDISRVFWKEQNGKTVLSAQAYIVGDVDAAHVRVNQYTIDLFPLDDPYMYQGEITVFETPDVLFNVVMTPAISIRAVSGMVYQDNIFWDNPLVLTPTPFDKYTKAKTSFGAITSLFDVSRDIYLGFIVLFTIALALKIFIEFKKQHPHIIFQTILMIGLLVILFEF